MPPRSSAPGTPQEWLARARSNLAFMLAVSTTLPDHLTDRPPLILVHGAANSASVWTFW